MAYFLSGVVLDSAGLPAERTVRAYLRSTGALVAASTSSQADGAFAIEVADGSAAYTVICLDELAGARNAQVLDRIVPVEGAPTDPHFSSVDLLLHLDGAHGSTAFPDSSPHGLAVSANGTPSISTAHGVSGGASMLLNGASSLRLPGGVGVHYPSGDFTLECMIRPASVSSSQAIFWKSTATGLYQWLVQITAAGKLGARCFDAGSNLVVDIASADSLVAGGWQHIAFTRSGPIFRLFIDGVLQASSSFSGGLRGADEPVGIGASESNAAALVAGSFLDEVRFTGGVARYTDTFVPAVPFPSA